MSLKSLGLCSPNIYEIGLSNEVLNIDFGQEAANILEVKVGGRKKYLPTRLTPAVLAQTGLSQQSFFRAPTLTFDIFATL